MNFTELFIRRPVLSIVLSLLILLLGFKAFNDLPLRQYPHIEYPTVNVTTLYPGASASLIKGFITTPLQQAIANAEGIDYITSTSNEGVSTIAAHLNPSQDVDAAMLEISALINKERGRLPQDALDPVVEKYQSLSAGTLHYLSFSSSEMSEEQITDYLATAVQPIISTIEGIGRADIRGRRVFAMRVWLDAEKMAALGVTATEVKSSIRRENYQSAAGQTKGEYVLFNVNAVTGIDNVDDFRNIVIQRTDNVLIRLKDVARVELGAESYNSTIRYKGQNAIFIKTTSSSSANPLDVSARVLAALPDIEEQLPEGMTLTVVFDATDAIRHSIDEVMKTILEASAIVILVIFLFLGSLRSVIIPVVTIPLSLVGVMSIMLMLGFSVNLLTLLAMVLAIGLVVDDAIVVVENIQRHIEEGMTPTQASIHGAREIALPVIAMTLTLAAVYAPVGMQEGLTGSLFTEFAFTLAGAVIVSGVVALTLSPMMCSKMLTAQTSDHRFVHFLDGLFEKLKCFYERKLTSTLQYRSVTAVFALIVIIATGFLFVETKRELAPHEDDGVVYVTGTGPLYSNLDYTQVYTQQVESFFDKLPEAESYFMINGAGNTAVNFFFSLLILDDWKDRDRDNKQIKDQLQAELGKVAGLRAYSFNMPSIPGSSTVGNLDLEFVVTSIGSEELLFQVAEKIKGRMYASGLFMYVNNDLKFNKPELKLNIKRDKAAELGLSMKEIGDTIGVMLNEAESNRFSIDDRSYKVIIQVEQDFRFNPDQLNKYYLRTMSGDHIPLATVVDYEIVTRPNELDQFQQLGAANLGAMLTPGVTLGESIEAIRNIAQQELPEGFNIDFLGQAKQFEEEGVGWLVTLLFAGILIYLVLAAQFESFRDPWIVLISVPMSICGALIPMALGMATFNIYTQIGLVTLIGLISKHGILIVDFANRLQQQEGLSPHDAVIKASAVRLRPILMTTAAMVFGVIPLLFATGAGSASRYNIGLVVTAGMSIGTLFTLFVVPTMYSFFARNHQNLSTEYNSVGSTSLGESGS